MAKSLNAVSDLPRLYSKPRGIREMLHVCAAAIDVFATLAFVSGPVPFSALEKHAKDAPRPRTRRGTCRYSVQSFHHVM